YAHAPLDRSFPTRRSSDLSIRNDSPDGQDIRWNGENVPAIDWLAQCGFHGQMNNRNAFMDAESLVTSAHEGHLSWRLPVHPMRRDRKSTRLNSSHGSISYA